MGSNERIISASRRTDIPAFYTPWFMNRIREGFCVYPNPLYPNKFYKVSLRNEDVLGIVFWTRHAAPLISHLSELDNKHFIYYFQYTINGYPKSIDPRSPSLDTAVKTFRKLSELIGACRVFWRYDPIVFNKEISEAWHKDNFLRIADKLVGSTCRLVVSVIDPYARTQRRVGSQEDGVFYDSSRYEAFLHWLAIESAQRSITVQTCAETALKVEGISNGSCVDANLLYELAGMLSPKKAKLHKQREGCLCHQSIDIGVNDSCAFGCQYCYATISHTKALETVKKHQPQWTCINQEIQLESPEKHSLQPRLL